MKKVNLDLFLTSLEGTVITKSESDPTAATIGWLAAQGLVVDIPGEPLTAAQKLDRFTLAQRCMAGGPIEFSEEQFSLVREQAAKAFGVRIAGPFLVALDSALLTQG